MVDEERLIEDTTFDNEWWETSDSEAEEDVIKEFEEDGETRNESESDAESETVLEQLNELIDNDAEHGNWPSFKN